MYRTFHRWAYRTATIVAVSALTGLTATYSGAASNPTPSSRVAPKSAAVCTPTANPGTLIAARGDSTAIYSHVAGSRSAPTNASQFATSVLGEAVRPPGASVTSISSASNLFVAESTPQIKGLTDVHDAFKVTSPLSTVYHYELTHLPRGAVLESTGLNCSRGVKFWSIDESVPVSGTHEYSAQLSLELSSISARSTLMRSDAQVSWVPSRPTSEKAPASSPVTLTIFSNLPGLGNRTVALSAAEVQTVTTRVNSLPLAATTGCAEGSPMYQLDYTLATSNFVATGYACGGNVAVSINGATAAPLYDKGLSLVSVMNKFLGASLKIGWTASTGGWAGWVNTPTPPGKLFQAVSAEWTVPTIKCDPLEMSAAVQWVGLDGFKNLVVEQDGSMTYCILGSGTFAAWFEMFGTSFNGGNMDILGGDFPVHPGDVMTAWTVAGQGSGVSNINGPNYPGAKQYLFMLNDLTTHWSFSQIVNAGVQQPQASAEWIDEQPSCPWACQAFSQHTTVTFTNMGVSDNTFAYPFGTNFAPGDLSGGVTNLITGSTTKGTGSFIPPGGRTETITWMHK